RLVVAAVVAMVMVVTVRHGGDDGTMVKMVDLMVWDVDDDDGGGEVMMKVLVVTAVAWQRRWCDGDGVEMWMCWRLLEKEADDDGWRPVTGGQNLAG
nr:hypothetical protein [Tanacetum cinerariifolium]